MGVRARRRDERAGETARHHQRVRDGPETGTCPLAVFLGLLYFWGGETKNIFVRRLLYFRLLYRGCITGELQSRVFQPPGWLRAVSVLWQVSQSPRPCAGSSGFIARLMRSSLDLG